MQSCPICKQSVPPSERYPVYVCKACMQRAVSAEGNRVRFYNQSLSGGYQRGVMVNGIEQFDTDPTCIIDGIVCNCEEAHLGGVVCIPQSRNYLKQGLIIAYLLIPAIVIPYVVLLIEAEHWLPWNALTWQQIITIIPAVLSAAQMIRQFILKGTPALRMHLDKSAIQISLTFLWFTGSMMTIGILEYFKWISETTVNSWTYALFYGFLSQLFYFALVLLPMMIAVQPKPTRR